MENINLQNSPEQYQTVGQKNNFNWWRTIAIGFGIASVGTAIAVGGYILETRKFQTVLENKVTNQLSSIPTPTPNETANWKTYSNSTYGFSVKYPSDFIYEEQTSDIFLLLTSFKNPSVIQSNGFYVEVRSLEKLDNAVNYERSRVVGHSADRIDKETKVTKEGFEAVKLAYSTLDDKNFTTFVVNDEKYTYTINAPANLFDQIISTFKFTDPAKTDETANWQTHTDTKLKFSIKYPSDIAISRTLPEGGVEFSLASELEKDFRERSIRLNIYYRGDKNITPKEAQESECPKPCTDVAEKTTINNASGVKVVSTNSERYYLASTNSNVVGIFLVFFDTTSKSFQTDLEKFRQILSTFTFTN